MRTERINRIRLYWIVLTTLSFAFPASGQNAKAIASRTIPSVVTLVMMDDTGDVDSIGSGFIVDNGIVATNYHVVKGHTDGFVKLVSDPVKPGYLKR